MHSIDLRSLLGLGDDGRMCCLERGIVYTHCQQDSFLTFAARVLDLQSKQNNSHDLTPQAGYVSASMHEFRPA